MKKILSILVFVFAISLGINAQVAFKPTVSNPTSTITNAGSDTINLVNQYAYQICAVQIMATKTSGTVGGTATLFQSVDGITYFAVDSALTLTNVATNSVIITSSLPARYWRVIFVGTGTMVARGFAVFQQPNY